MRLDSSGLLEALEEIDPASSKLIKTGRTGVLKSLVDQAVALAAHEGAVSEVSESVSLCVALLIRSSFRCCVVRWTLKN
jgi:hypothetical protein